MVEAIYLKSIIKRFKEYKALGEKTLDQLDTDQLLQQPNAASNSIAIIMQHLHGNMVSRWSNFLTEDGEKTGRNRDAEFEVQPQTKESLLGLWHEGWAVVLHTLEALQPEDLTKTITIRSEPLDVVDALNRQLAHYSYHIGQMVYLGRWMKNESWQSLSIPKNGSAAFNEAMKASRH